MLVIWLTKIKFIKIIIDKRINKLIIFLRKSKNLWVKEIIKGIIKIYWLTDRLIHY